MKNACGNQEADNGKTTERNRMINRKKEKCRIDERGNEGNESNEA